MSKSSACSSGRIDLTDSKDVIKKKILSATTDSENKVYYDVTSKPGISNLLNIHRGVCER